VAYPFQWGTCCKQLIAASQSADSENWLATFLLIAGISVLLPFEQINSGVQISAIS
jgi:hypothetical protein